MAMRRVIKQKWLNALRSGKYDQIDGQLCDGNTGYCCLGVLASITGNLDEKKWTDGYPNVKLDSNGDENPRPFCGLSVPLQERLISMNDEDKCDFKEIASYISKNVKAVD